MALAKLLSRRGMKRGLASVTAVLCSVGLYQGCQPKTVPAVRFLVTKRPLQAGDVLYFRDLALEAASEAELSELWLTDQQLALVQGAILTEPVPAGGKLRADQMLPATDAAALGYLIPNGKRAYALSPKNQLKAAPRDHVDLLLQSPGTKPQVLAEQVLVLRGSDEDYSAILVALSVDQISVLEKAKNEGELLVVLRNPRDFKKTSLKAWERKTRRKPRAKKTKTQLWVEKGVK